MLVPGEGVASEVAERLPWRSELFAEPANGASSFEERIGAPPGSSEEILTTASCRIEPNPEPMEFPSGSGIFPFVGLHVQSAPRFEGELRPSVGPGFNGGGTVESPAYAHFNLNRTSPEFSGELPSLALGPGNGARDGGDVKFEGYGTNQLIRVREG